MTNKLDAFDTRMDVLNRAGAPGSEIDAAVRVYERLRTAKAACIAEFGEQPPIEAVLAIFRQLCVEA
jgi:predicted HNH restriction endonuclease